MMEAFFEAILMGCAVTAGLFGAGCMIQYIGYKYF